MLLVKEARNVDYNTPYCLIGPMFTEATSTASDQANTVKNNA